MAYDGVAMNHAFSAMSFIGFVLVCIPLPWHLESWNVGTCLYMIWTAIALIIGFVNSIIWDGNALDSARWWCEITTRIQVGAEVAIPAASLCIMRRLYCIACVRSTGMSKREKRNSVIIDLCIGILLPAIFMALYYIYQGNRYNIFENFGCTAVPYNTPMAFALDYSWPLVIGIISAIYGLLAVLVLRRRQSEFKQALQEHNNLNSNRYFRLMALAFTDVIFTIPITSYFLWVNLAQNPVYGWSWVSSHDGFDRVDTVPAVLWQNQAAGGFEVSRWVNVLGAFVFFGFFGFSEEARRHYYPLMASSLRVFGFSGNFTTISNRGTTTAITSAPIAFRGVSRQVEKRVSVTSFSSDASFEAPHHSKDVELTVGTMTDIADVQSTFSEEDVTRTASAHDLSTPPGFESSASEKV